MHSSKPLKASCPNTASLIPFKLPHNHNELYPELLLLAKKHIAADCDIPWASQNFKAQFQ